MSPKKVIHVRTKGKRGKGRISGTNDPDQSIFKTDFRVMNGSFTASNTAATFAITEVDLNPSAWGTRGVAFADLYEKYRIVDLQIDLLANPGLTTTATQAMYMPGNCNWYIGAYYSSSGTFTTPTTVAQFCDFPHFAWSTDQQPKTLRFHLGRRDLMKHMISPWLQTVSTGVTSIELCQLCISVASLTLHATTNPSTSSILLNYAVEFTGSVDPALIPGRVMKRYLTSGGSLHPEPLIGEMGGQLHGDYVDLNDGPPPEEKKSVLVKPTLRRTPSKDSLLWRTVLKK